MESHYFAGLFSLCSLWGPSPTLPVVQGGPVSPWAFSPKSLGAGTLFTGPANLAQDEPCAGNSLLVQKLTLCLHCRGCGFYLWSGSQEPMCCAGTVKNILKNNLKKMSPVLSGFIMAPSRESLGGEEKAS